MPDLDKLRSLGEQIRPPDLSRLEDTARRRSRRAAVGAAGTGLAAALLVAGGVVALGAGQDDRSNHHPITPGSPTPTPTPQVTPTPDAEPTHQSETSMTPKEVVLADNAGLAYAGVSADDPDFRVSVWTAECTWCPLQFEDPPTRPTFKAIAVTTDAWETTRYRRPPRGTAGIFYVHSAAPGTLLIVDPANGGEWLVHDDATTTLLPHVVEERLTESPRSWFSCRLSGTDRTTWCAYDEDTEAVYEWGTAWSGGPDDDISAVSPAAGVEPWGRERLRPDEDGPLTAWWYHDGVRRSRTLIESLPFNSRAGSVLGADEGDLLYWAVARGDDRMRFFVGDDLGQSWREIGQQYPADPAVEAQVAVLATPEGNLLLRAVEESADGSRVRLWRLDSLEEGDWTQVYDSGAVPGWIDNALENPLSVVGSRLVMGSLSSDDDGRTWTTIERWR